MATPAAGSEDSQLGLIGCCQGPERAGGRAVEGFVAHCAGLDREDDLLHLGLGRTVVDIKTKAKMARVRLT